MTEAANLVTQSAITCPACQSRAIEQMPMNACQVFYDCKGCGRRLKPKPGDCCVFCSYGSVQVEVGCFRLRPDKYMTELG